MDLFAATCCGIAYCTLFCVNGSQCKWEGPHKGLHRNVMLLVMCGNNTWKGPDWCKTPGWYAIDVCYWWCVGWCVAPKSLKLEKGGRHQKFMQMKMLEQTQMRVHIGDRHRNLTCLKICWANKNKGLHVWKAPKECSTVEGIWNPWGVRVNMGARHPNFMVSKRHRINNSKGQHGWKAALCHG